MLVAVGAVPAGLLMIVDPTGGLMRMPLSMLDRAPFADFFWPGVILTAAIGIVPLVVAWAVVRRKAWAVPGHVVVGTLLSGWIVVEVAMVGYHWLQGTYLGLGVVIMGLGLWRRRRESEGAEEGAK